MQWWHDLQPQKAENIFRVILFIAMKVILFINLYQENYLGAFDLGLACTDTFLSININKRKKGVDVITEK
jgi:hypothetical protein